MRIRSLVLSLTAITLACAPAGDETAADSAAMEPAGLGAAECWRRDNPTVEQLAERPSAPAETTIRLGNDEMRICYSQPRANDREVMGALVPFGAEWRTGANEATAIHLTFPASIGGMEVEPGSYSLVTLPREEEWEIILNSEAERWGVGGVHRGDGRGLHHPSGGAGRRKRPHDPGMGEHPGAGAGDAPGLVPARRTG